MQIEPSKASNVLTILALITLVFMSWALLKWPAFLKFDQSIHAKIPNLQGNRFWHAIAWIGQPKLTVVYDLCLAAFLCWQQAFIPALWVVATLGSIDAIGIGVKLFFKRSRPKGHLVHDDGYSFPSGHVLGTTTLMLMLWTLWPHFMIGFIGAIWLGLVATSRLVLYAHYPSDVFSTIVLATGWVAFMRELAPLLTQII